MADELLYEVTVPGRELTGLAASLGDGAVSCLRAAGHRLATALNGRRIVSINSTPVGGGAAEMLRDLLPYARAADIDCRWLVIGGNADFFTVTKRVHNRIYGFQGDGGRLGAAERRQYDEIHRAAAVRLGTLVRPDDIVLIHDPQPLGLTPAVRDLGLPVVWRCHIGTDQSNEYTEEAWDFLRPYLDGLDVYVFSRASFAPPWLPADRVAVVPPSIDPSSVKNREIDDATAAAVLAYCGLRQGRIGETPSFVRRDGTTASLRRHADILQSGPPPPAGAPLIVQISRWDRMKNMDGVMTAFAENLSRMGDAHLALVGPAVTGYADDPPAVQVLLECMTLWRTLTHEARSRIHLACLPMADAEENAFIVNAVQRQAAVVTQMSLSEGFGLTVAEAMWKSRAVVASRIGGIQEQIVDGAGVLVPPADGAALAQELESLVHDADRRSALGRAAHERARSYLLADRHLLQYADLFLRLCAL